MRVLLAVDDLSAERENCLVRFRSRPASRTAGRIAFDDERARRTRIAERASAKALPAATELSSADLCARQLARLAGSGPARASIPRSLVRDRARIRSGSPRGTGEVLVDGRLDEALDAGLPSFVFVCPSNCGLRSP